MSRGNPAFRYQAHDPRNPRRCDVTVCIAALFRFNYALIGSTPDVGTAALTLSDRMVTAGDVQYEPQQLKIAQITPRTIIMIAGEYSVHSQALLATHRQVRSDPSVSPYNISLIYGASCKTPFFAVQNGIGARTDGNQRANLVLFCKSLIWAITSSCETEAGRRYFV